MTFLIALLIIALVDKEAHPIIHGIGVLVAAGYVLVYGLFILSVLVMS